MAPVVTAAGPRSMGFELRPHDDGERWHWTVYAHPDPVPLRSGQIVGDRDKAERAARAAIAIMGGVVTMPERA